MAVHGCKAFYLMHLFALLCSKDFPVSIVPEMEADLVQNDHVQMTVACVPISFGPNTEILKQQDTDIV
jgi:hypothetical protein